MKYVYGLRFDTMPGDVVMNRILNPDGSITKTMWMEDRTPEQVWQAYHSPAPISAIPGTKRVVRREVGEVEVLS